MLVALNDGGQAAGGAMLSDKADFALQETYRMRFTHFMVDNARIIDRQEIDATDLDPAMRRATAMEWRRLWQEVEQNLVVAASGDDERIQAALQRQFGVDCMVPDDPLEELRRRMGAAFRKGPPRIVAGYRFGVTLGAPGAGLDESTYESMVRHSFVVWARNVPLPVLSGGILSASEPEEEMALAPLVGMIAGARRDLSGEQARHVTEEDRAQVRAVAEEIVRSRPSVMTIQFQNLGSPRRDEQALRFALHFAAAMLDR